MKIILLVLPSKQPKYLNEEGFCAEKLFEAEELKRKAENMDITLTELHQINLN